MAFLEQDIYIINNLVYLGFTNENKSLIILVGNRSRSIAVPIEFS